MLEVSAPRISTVVVFLLLSLVLVPNFAAEVDAQSPSQPSTFYFHRQSSKTLNNITTTLWANTTQIWSGAAQTEARSVVQGSPGFWRFYSQPALAGNVTFTGPLSFTVYLSSSSSTGSGTVITGTVSRIDPSGSAVPLAVSSLSGTPVTTSITAFTLTISSNTYQIDAGDLFEFMITVSITSSTTRTVTLRFDTSTYKSRISITFESRVGISSFSTLNQTGVATGFFSKNWTVPARQVTLRASVFNALGLYDISSVRVNVTSPSGSFILLNTPLTRVQGTGADYAGAFALNLTYTSADETGSYGASVVVVENSGITLGLQQSYTIYTVWIVGLRTLSQDSTPIAVEGVSVSIFAGAVGVFSGVSDASGSLATFQLRDDTSYSITAHWQGYLVNQTSSYRPGSSVTVPLSVSVYQTDLTSTFRDGNGNSLSEYPPFRLTHPNGTVTVHTGPLNTRLPAGTHSISGVTWRGVDVSSDTVTFNPRNGPPTISLRIYDATVLVVDQDGRAISSARVTLSLGGQTLAEGVTDEDGVLIIRSLPGGQYIVQADYQSLSAKNTLDLSKDASSRVEVNLAPSSAWIGQSMTWILLVAAALGGFVGYRQLSRSRLAFRDEPFEHLDSMTGGGFRNGDVVLIKADEGAGKTTMCEQLAYKAVTSGSPVVFLTYDTPESVRESMKSFHWDPSAYEAKRQFELVGFELSLAGTGIQSSGILESFYDVTALSISINAAIDGLRMGTPTVFVDSLTPLLERPSLKGMIQETAERVRRLQGRLFLTVDRRVPRTALVRLEEAVDTIVEMVRVTEGESGLMELRVRKLRGRRLDTESVRMRIDRRKGIIFQLRRRIHSRPVSEDGKNILLLGEREVGKEAMDREREQISSSEGLDSHRGRQAERRNQSR